MVPSSRSIRQLTMSPAAQDCSKGREKEVKHISRVFPLQKTDCNPTKPLGFRAEGEGVPSHSSSHSIFEAAHLFFYFPFSTRNMHRTRHIFIPTLLQPLTCYTEPVPSRDQQQHEAGNWSAGAAKQKTRTACPASLKYKQLLARSLPKSRLRRRGQLEGISQGPAASSKQEEPLAAFSLLYTPFLGGQLLTLP